MPEYEYEIIESDGRLVKGQAEAATVTDLVRELSAGGGTVVEVHARRSAGRAVFRRRLRPQERVTAFHELAVLLGSGVSLGDAVQAQARGSNHPEIGAAFQSMATALLRGQSFREALRGAGLELPSYLHHLVEAGELSGRLAEALRRAVEQMQYDQRVAAELRSALLYPAILVLAGFAAVLLVFVFVIPQFSNLLEEANELPLLAEAVLRTGVWFNANAVLVAAVIAAALAVAVTLLRQPAVRQRARDAVAALPVLGGWLGELDTAKWASLMSAMLASRVSLLDALGLASRGVRLTRRRTTLEQATGDVRGGASLSAALEKRSALTPTAYNLLRVGEHSGAALRDAARARRALRGERHPPDEALPHRGRAAGHSVDRGISRGHHDRNHPGDHQCQRHRQSKRSPDRVTHP